MAPTIDPSDQRQQPQGSARLFSTLNRWHQAWVHRRELAQMDDDSLKDLGISRVDAQREADKPFWDNSRPQHPHDIIQ